MKVDAYLEVAHRTDRLPTESQESDINPRFGLAGEIGILLTQLKKEVRDYLRTPDATTEAVKDELGDIAWYAATIAKRAGIDFKRDVLLGNLRKIDSVYTDKNPAPTPLLELIIEGGGDIKRDLDQLGITAVESFDDYQNLAARTAKYSEDRTALITYLVQIWTNAGNLLEPFGHSKKDSFRDETKESVAGAIGDVMWYVALIAKHYGLSLGTVMKNNYEKILSAFPPPDRKKPTPLYDEEVGLGPLEQFPRLFDVDFVQQDDNTAVMLVGGVRVGDPLTDNAHRSQKPTSDLIDGYRFHDSIHLAFVAVLGWSPVMRSLLMRKRKSKKEVDEVEDGARAKIVEEMIVKIAHTYAVGFSKETLLDDRDHVNLNLLKDISKLAAGLEVAGARDELPAVKFWEWEKAILDGFRIYNQLRSHSGGRIRVDLQKRKITFREIELSEATKIPISD